MSLNVVSARKGRSSESSDDYPAIVAMLDEKTRVIECAAGLQWIIQKRVRDGRHAWLNLYFCSTKEGLLLYARPITRELLALPAHFSKRRDNWIDWPAEVPS